MDESSTLDALEDTPVRRQVLLRGSCLYVAHRFNRQMEAKQRMHALAYCPERDSKANNLVDHVGLQIRAVFPLPPQLHHAMLAGPTLISHEIVLNHPKPDARTRKPQITSDPA